MMPSELVKPVDVRIVDSTAPLWECLLLVAILAGVWLTMGGGVASSGRRAGEQPEKAPGGLSLVGLAHGACRIVAGYFILVGVSGVGILLQSLAYAAESDAGFEILPTLIAMVVQIALEVLIGVFLWWKAMGFAVWITKPFATPTNDDETTPDDAEAAPDDTEGQPADAGSLLHTGRAMLIVTGLFLFIRVLPSAIRETLNVVDSLDATLRLQFIAVVVQVAVAIDLVFMPHHLWRVLFTTKRLGTTAPIATPVEAGEAGDEDDAEDEEADDEEELA